MKIDPVLSIIGALLFVLGAGLSWDYSANHYGAEISRIKETLAKDQSNADRAALERLQKAQALGDQLSERLSKTEARLRKKEKELSNEIARNADGIVCLNSRLVGLLNAQQTGEAASALDAAHGAIATDTDVAGWINSAQKQYEVCRGRLNALIDFNEGKDDVGQ
jgi:hypothetical protein